MRWRDTPATAVVAGVTLLTSALLLLSGSVAGAAIGAGFIPLRWSSVAIPADHLFLLPSWLTPIGATMIHAGLAHLALNLVVLVFCGQQTERALGWGGAVLIYLVGAYAAAVGQWALSPGSAVPMIGASGAISAWVASYALLYGRTQAPAIGPIPARIVHVLWLAAAWVGIQILIGFAGMGGTSVAIGAHVGGFIAGLLLTRPVLLWRWRAA